VFGGYTTCSWHSNSAYTTTDGGTSWLFRLNDPTGTWHPLKFPSKNCNPIYGNANYGPTFGNAHDLFLNLENRIASYSNITSSHGYTNSSGIDAQVVLAGNYDKWGNDIQEVEVLEIKDISRANIPVFNANFNLLDQKKNFFRNYLPPFPQLKVQKINVLIVGGAGSGKSSYINTINYSLNDIFGQLAPSKPTASGGHVTTVYRQYQMAPCINLCDTKGWSNKTYKFEELSLILDGVMPPNMDMNTPNLTYHHPLMRKDATRNECIHTIIIFSPVEEAADLEYCEKLKLFVEQAEKRQMTVIVVLSKCDELDTDLVNEPEKIYQSDEVRELIGIIHDKCDIDYQNIIPIISLAKYIQGNNTVCFIALYALERAILQGNLNLQRLTM